MNPIYSIKQNTISYINRWKNCVVFLILFVFISYNAKAQSFQTIRNSTGIVTLNTPDLVSGNKAISIGKDADKETNYKISVTPPKVEDCPNKEKLDDLCYSIFMHQEDEDPESPYAYEYQRIILEASCANPEKDSEAELSRKVNLLWQKYENDLVCSSVNFSVTKGNILKYAVSRRFMTVIEDAAHVWKVNLNRIDPSDDSTVLDYIQKEMQVYKGSQVGDLLEQYYEFLRKAGAKHANELKK